MAFVSLQLNDLFEKTFGYKTDAFNFNKVPANYPDYGLAPDRKTHAALGAPFWHTDKFGREYYMPAQMTYPETIKELGESTDLIQTVWLPYPVLSIDGAWNIVKTQLTQRTGTFKQIVNRDDYKITVRGIIVSKDNSLPEEEMTMLKKLFESPGTKSLTCALTDILLSNQEGGKYGVVTESLKFLETRSSVNTRGYELQLTSDANFNLTEKKGAVKGSNSSSSGKG